MPVGAAWPILHEETVQRLLPPQVGVQIQGVTGPAQNKATSEQHKRNPPRGSASHRQCRHGGSLWAGQGAKGSRPAPLPCELLAALEPKKCTLFIPSNHLPILGRQPEARESPGLVPWPRAPVGGSGSPCCPSALAAVRLWFARTAVGHVGSSVAPLCKAGFGSPWGRQLSTFRE